MNQNSIKRCAVTQLGAFWFLVQKHVGYILRFGRAVFMLSDRRKTFFLACRSKAENAADRQARRREEETSAVSEFSHSDSFFKFVLVNMTALESGFQSGRLLGQTFMTDKWTHLWDMKAAVEHDPFIWKAEKRGIGRMQFTFPWTHCWKLCTLKHRGAAAAAAQLQNQFQH